MYLDFFKLQNLPFRMTADPRFHYKDARRVAAANLLLESLSRRASAETASPETGACILVSGDAGVGKTILVHDVLAQLPEQFVVVQIRQPEISVAEFHEAIAAELGGDAPVGAAAGAKLDACLERQAGLNRRVVLAMDDGELLAEKLLDEVFRLPGRSGAAAGSLRVVLTARPAVESALRKSRLGDREIGLRIKLLPLTAEETRNYIEHRLRVAGRLGGAIFSEDALAEMHRFTGGVPRLINTLADAALMAAFNRSHDTVTPVEVRGAANQLQWVEFNARAEGGDAKAPVVDERSVGHIRIEHNQAAVAEFDLPLGTLSLGRATNNDVRIDSRYVSRNHCRIVTTAQYSVIEDLQSQNGLMVASRRVSVHRLRHGDRVQLGEHILTYTLSPLLGTPKTQSFPLNLGAGPNPSDTGQTGLIAALPGAVIRTDPKE